jgi:hypothetical protein
MLMKARERWHRISPACGCQVVVEIGGEIEGQNPRCACGGIMRKKYTSAVFGYLAFLRPGEPGAAALLSQAQVCLAHTWGAPSSQKQ